MTSFKHALGNAQLIILILLGALVLSFLCNVFFGVLLYKVPREMTVYVPPNIPQKGLYLKNDQIPDATIYRFAYQTWSNIMTWSQNGAEAFKDNLANNRLFLTNQFENSLKSEIQKINESGFLYKHTQIVMGANGGTFHPQDVKYIGNDTWLVHLDMRTINYVEGQSDTGGFSQAHVASDAENSFVFKVVRKPINQASNPIGLALAGYAAPPKIIKIYK